MTTPSEILFGGALKPVKRQILADGIGVDVSTIGRWKRNPDQIRFGDLKTIVRMIGLTDRQILMLFGRGDR